MTSIEKSLTLLTQFSKAPYHYTVAELAGITGLNRTTVYRDVCLLEKYGMLMRREEAKGYVAGPFMYHMGHIYLQNIGLEDRVLAILREISDLTQTTAGLARREHDKVLSIYSVDHSGKAHGHGLPGQPHPIYKGAYGKGLMAFYAPERVDELLDSCTFEKTGPATLSSKDGVLAEYEQIRRQGYVTSVDEVAPGLVGVGIPLRDATGAVKNMVAASFEYQSDYLPRLMELRDVLTRYCDELERFLQ